jgi:DNA polymerase
VTQRPFSFDAETHSPVDLRANGADAYTRDPRTRCLMFAYHRVGEGGVARLWREGDPLPYDLIGHLANGVSLAGWNVISFDRGVWNRILVPRHGFPEVPDGAWRDSMHLAAAANLPRSLEGCANAVGVVHDSSLKDSNRIRRITDANRTPIPATVAEILNSPGNFDAKLVEDLQWLAARCVQDVSMEEGVLVRLPPWPDMEPWLNMPAIDRRINDRGVMIDVPLVRGLARAAAVETARLDKEMNALTGGAVPRTTNVESLKEWLVARKVELPPNVPKKRRGELDGDDEASDDNEDDKPLPDGKKSPWRLRKGDIADLMARDDVPEECRLGLALRAEAAKASTAKLKAMLRIVDARGRLRGPFVLGGAQQTLRWSGAAWQPHNLVRDAFANLDDVAETNGLNAKTDKAEVKRLSDVALWTAIEVGRTGDADLMRAMYETTRKDAQGRAYRSGVIHWISRMLRRTISAPQGMLLLNGDWAQVEARITVWLSQQLDVLNAFATGQDVYKVAAAGIFLCAIDAITKLMRQTGKVSILALGFGGAVDALVAMAATHGILMTRAEAAPIVKAWRAANRQTVAYWYATDDAAANAVLYPGQEFAVPPLGLVSYFTQGDCLCCRLPSTRVLRYWQPRLRQEHWEDGTPKDRLSLSGLAIKGHAVFRRSLYHTILVENQVQAIGADMLATALGNADRANVPVVMHVHDSLAAEADESRAEAMLPVFGQTMYGMPAWCRGLPIGVDLDASARFG